MTCPQSTRDFFYTTVPHLVPDPSPEVPSGPDIATLRLFDLYELTQWTIYADDHDKTVLEGFSSLGGFSSFINAIFSTIFGTTLLLVAFGELSRTPRSSQSAHG